MALAELAKILPFQPYSTLVLYFLTLSMVGCLVEVNIRPSFCQEQKSGSSFEPSQQGSPSQRSLNNEEEKNIPLEEEEEFALPGGSNSPVGELSLNREITRLES
jgi:hypothetical protein